jgi:hypothetical protein
MREVAQRKKAQKTSEEETLARQLQNEMAGKSLKVDSSALPSSAAQLPTENVCYQQATTPRS